LNKTYANQKTRKQIQKNDFKKETSLEPAIHSAFQPLNSIGTNPRKYELKIQKKEKERRQHRPLSAR